MLIAAGLTFMLTGVLSIVAMAKESKPLFAVSISLYLPIILLLAAAGWLSHVLRREMHREFDVRLLTALKIYDPKAASWHHSEVQSYVKNANMASWPDSDVSNVKD